jgi:nucleoid-associated protein YgaU
MQSIERYGLVALVFLGITITAACLWEPEKDSKADGSAGAELARKEPAATPPARQERRDFVGARTNETARNQGKGLSVAQRQELLALQGRGGAPAATDRTPPATPGRALFGDAFASAAQPDVVVPAPETVQPRQEVEPIRSTAAPRLRLYEIKAQDTLSEIAMRELGTWKRWQEIVDLNPGLDPNHLRKGARIKLPVGERSLAATSEAPTGAARGAGPDKGTSNAKKSAAGGSTHVVQEDESLWKIAELRLGEGERWTEIAALNPDIDANRLKPGMELVLPSGGEPSGAGSTRAASAEPTVAKAAPERSTKGKVR